MGLNLFYILIGIINGWKGLYFLTGRVGGREMSTIKQHLMNSLVLIFIIINLVGVTSCEPPVKITFINEQNQEIRIFAAHVGSNGNIDEKFVQKGTISNREKKTIYITFLGDEWVNRIEARDPNGNVVFSHDYNMPDLEKIDWKITITP